MSTTRRKKEQTRNEMSKRTMYFGSGNIYENVMSCIQALWHSISLMLFFVSLINNGSVLYLRNNGIINWQECKEKLLLTTRIV